LLPSGRFGDFSEAPSQSHLILRDKAIPMQRNPTKESFNPFALVQRRSFLRGAGACAALGSTSILSTLLNLKLTNSVMAARDDLTDYKAMVCIFLYGGNDSFNMLTPYEQSEYDDYASIRSNLAIDRGDLLPINSGQQGRQLGMHPGLSSLSQSYTDGKLAFLANVGSLVEPINKSNFSQRQKPQGLYSHSDLVQHWQTNVPQNRTQATGWAGRMSDLLSDTVNANSNIAMNIALGGINIFQSGAETVPYVISDDGASVLEGYNGNWGRMDKIYTRFTDSALAENYADVLEKTYANTKRTSIDAADRFNSATGESNLTTVFPGTSLGNQLKMVAKTIDARAALGHGRQIFFVTHHGWDNHDEVLNNQMYRLPQVAQAMQAFYDATVEMNIADKVTSFTASDFGRTLASNGNGSDHGWGGNQMIMGGAVQGGRVYGDYPETLRAGNDLDLDRGRLIPTTSVDQYSAELAFWFGMSNDSDLETVIPNIREFYGSGETSDPIGFLGSGTAPGTGNSAPAGGSASGGRDSRTGGSKGSRSSPSKSGSSSAGNASPGR
jgi:uncharacterized protein (DUF1501 family)